MHRSTEDINGGGGVCVPHILFGTLVYPSFNKSIQRCPGPSPTTAGLPFTACKANTACCLPFPLHHLQLQTQGWTLDMALLLDLTRPKAFHRGSNEVTGVCFRQL